MNSKIKRETEELIISSLKNYTIFRVPSVMCNPLTEKIMYNVPLNSNVELISSYDAGYAFVSAIEHQKELKKRIFNLSGGEKCRVRFRDYLINVLSIYGLSIRYFLTFFLVDKNFYGAYYEDGEELDSIIHFRKDSVLGFYNNLEEDFGGIRRLIPRLLAKPVIMLLKKKKDN